MKYFLTIAILISLFISDVSSQNYKTAAGLRAVWGLGLTGKHFINENSAAELIINNQGFGLIGFRYRFTRITALYEIHNALDDQLEGLSWYYGGGVFAGFFSGAFSDFVQNRTQVGLTGVLGLDYKFEDLPINVSLDWMPGFSLTGGTGFVGRAGGLAIRYVF